VARAYAPHTTSREYIIKTQLIKLKMKLDETPFVYLIRAQELASAPANIGEPVKDKDLVLHVIHGLRDEYNGLDQCTDSVNSLRFQGTIWSQKYLKK
ncbi:MAG: hypothetical protein Q8755_03045, partial [Candidatus Phytoplasma australasiaticum]|nr:hypothetical protein [Candidatus Phytoplasma australasiaticum]